MLPDFPVLQPPPNLDCGKYRDSLTFGAIEQRDQRFGGANWRYFAAAQRLARSRELRRDARVAIKSAAQFLPNKIVKPVNQLILAARGNNAFGSQVGIKALY